MAFTEHYTILNDLPLFWEPELLAAGRHVSRFHRDLPSRLGVIPRRGAPGDIRWFEFDPTYVLHWTNAYEEGDEVIVRRVLPGLPGAGQRRDCRAGRPAVPLPGAGPDADAAAPLADEPGNRRDQRRGPFRHLHRVRQHQQRVRAAARYRYTYAATNEPGWFLFNGLVKHDTLTGREEQYRFEQGVFCSEVGVAPRVGGTGEDDAYLVTLTIDMNRDLSECVVFRASDVGSGPVARAQLPERVASGTHSCWASGQSIKNWQAAS